MGSFDGVKVCKLVGILILSQLSNISKNTDMELYRDDGLIIIRNPDGPKLEIYRKKIYNALKLLGFKITIYANLKIVNFLNVTLNLRKDTHNFIHTSSNYPPSIIKQIPKSINCRLSNNSSNVDIFNKYKHIYNNAQNNSSYKQTLKYTPSKSKPKHRSRNITWFNPPYNKCITSNIRRDFLNLKANTSPIIAPELKFSTEII